MLGILEVQNTLTEDQFENLIRSKNLTVEERESLRKHLHLPCNEVLLSCLTSWRGYALRAMQKIEGICP
jgi:hypothetical protein